jgi:hypothetical protein
MKDLPIEVQRINSLQERQAGHLIFEAIVNNVVYHHLKRINFQIIKKPKINQITNQLQQ